ncbi:hypothetical protein LTR86_005744 [Recurvomyces mirabilis]|nr:hypothetical protein LTR86_005744 [Recurvomyces mirabilis]
MSDQAKLVHYSAIPVIIPGEGLAIYYPDHTAWTSGFFDETADNGMVGEASGYKSCCTAPVTPAEDAVSAEELALLYGRVRLGREKKNKASRAWREGKKVEENEDEDDLAQLAPPSKKAKKAPPKPSLIVTLKIRFTPPNTTTETS